jgi:ferredoxin
LILDGEKSFEERSRLHDYDLTEIKRILREGAFDRLFLFRNSISEYRENQGTPKVLVDWNKCNGCGACVNNCPVSVFELQDLPNYLDSKKSVPIRANDCIMCMTCVTSCPSGGVTVTE